MTEIPTSPPRLVHDGSGDSELLRQANREFTEGLDEARAFRRLDDRLSRRARGRQWGLGVGLAAAIGGYVLYASRDAPTFELTAEPVVEQRAAPEPALAAPVPIESAPSPPALAPTTSSAPRRPSPPSPLVASSARASHSAKRSEALAPTPVAAVDASECLAFARAGDTSSAEDCFEKRAAGTGLGAELSLYELSRLRRDLLDDPTGALEALELHRKRFPNGGLRPEVELTRVELLVRTGRVEEALAEVERLLASGTSRERAAELAAIRESLRAPSPRTR